MVWSSVLNFVRQSAGGARDILSGEILFQDGESAHEHDAREHEKAADQAEHGEPMISRVFRRREDGTRSCAMWRGPKSNLESAIYIGWGASGGAGCPSRTLVDPAGGRSLGQDKSG